MLYNHCIFCAKLLKFLESCDYHKNTEKLQLVLRLWHFTEGHEIWWQFWYNTTDIGFVIVGVIRKCFRGVYFLHPPCSTQCLYYAWGVFRIFQLSCWCFIFVTGDGLFCMAGIWYDSMIYCSFIVVTNVEYSGDSLYLGNNRGILCISVKNCNKQKTVSPDAVPGWNTSVAGLGLGPRSC